MYLKGFSTSHWSLNIGWMICSGTCTVNSVNWFLCIWQPILGVRHHWHHSASVRLDYLLEGFLFVFDQELWHVFADMFANLNGFLFLVKQRTNVCFALEVNLSRITSAVGACGKNSIQPVSQYSLKVTSPTFSIKKNPHLNKQFHQSSRFVSIAFVDLLNSLRIINDITDNFETV